jgi:hypothetical protein
MSKHHAASLPLAIETERPIGRPTLYRPELCDQIIAAMGEGLSVEAAAAKVGISVRSLYYWQQEHPEFMQSIQEGRIRALLWWEQRALEMAQGKPGSQQVVILALKNRSRSAGGWHDSAKLELTAAVGVPTAEDNRPGLSFENLSNEELDLFAALLLKAGPHLEDQR